MSFPSLLPLSHETLNHAGPRAKGFRMPAEWEHHEATWLSWPRNPETWPQERLQNLKDTYARMMEPLLAYEKVKLLVADALERDQAVEYLRKAGLQNFSNLQTFIAPSTDIWIRDYGPTFLKNSDGKKAWCKWHFSAWGGKYESFKKDNNVFGPGQQLIPEPCFHVEIQLEGGSIEVNGKGTCLVSEQCLLNPNRNPQLSKQQIETYLCETLGVSQILWLGEGIVGDDTDGHIDDIARFVGEDRILTVYEENSSDANFKALEENWRRLKKMRDPKGHPWKLERLPMPGALFDGDVRLPASYANFYIANQLILLPTFDDPQDKNAKAILKDFFPEREVVAIPAQTLVHGLGAIHCATQQEPA